MGIGTKTYTDTEGNTVVVDLTEQRTQNLKNALSLDGTTNYAYAGGYMLLRYFAKQVADSFGETVSGSASEMTINSVMDSIVPSTSFLWPETTAMVADTRSELASAMTSGSNDLCTSLNGSGTAVFGTDFLSPGLFTENTNNGLWSN